MSYRFYCERVEPIGQKTEAAGTDIVLPVNGYEGMRLTIPFLSVQCAATAQLLSILQVKEYDRISAFNAAEKKITVNQIGEDLEDIYIAAEKNDGEYFFSKVSDSEGKVHTVTDPFQEGTLKPAGRFFVFSSPGDEESQCAVLDAEKVNNLSLDAPGVFVARDFCFPVIIHITNGTNAAKLLAGIAAYISR